MKVYVVKTLWKNDDDFGSYVELFSTKEKAREYFSRESGCLDCDYGIDLKKDADCLFKHENSYEYINDYDYFYIEIEETEVS